MDVMESYMGVGKLKNLFKIIKDEGLDTFLYLIKEKNDAKKSEEARYRKYVKLDEPRINEKYLCSGYSNEIEILELNEESTISSLKKAALESDCAYIGLKQSNVMLHENGCEIMNRYIVKRKRQGIICDVIYGNEDTIDTRTGKRTAPKFKPEYSFDTLLSYNYIGDFACIRKEVLVQCLDEINEISDRLLYEILLRLSLKKNVRFDIINTVLWHNLCGRERKSTQNLTELKREILREYGIKSCVTENISDAEIQYVDYEYHGELISIVIPSKDNPQLLAKCLDSIKENTPHANYEIVVVDNGSSPANKDRYKRLADTFEKACMYIYEPMEFNFSRMCNIGAANASGKLLLFLNDDIEIIPQKYCTDMCRDWLEILAGQALVSNVGAVGVKLMYPDGNSLQHVGVVNYEKAGLAHIYARAKDDDSVKDYRNKAVYNYLCVTGACIMVEKSKFIQVGGFNEQFAVTHNDIELCFHLYKEGYSQVQRNDIALLHHESFSRGDDNKEKELRNMRERELLYLLYPDYEKWDPYYSPCLEQLEFDCNINTDIYSVIYIRPKKTNMQIGEVKQSDWDKPGVKAQVTSCTFREDLQIRGYIYRETGNYRAGLTPYIILFNEHNTYEVKAESICDRVFHERKGIDRHINFAPFFCGINTDEMEKGRYSIGIYAGKEMMNTNITVNVGR